MRRARRLCRRKGFTLIELVVAIAIMAILASALGLAIASIARKAIENSCKDATRNYYALSKAAMNQLNSGVSVYSNGVFTTNDDINALLQRVTGSTPVRLLRLDDKQDASTMRPFNSDEEGYYVGIRYADPTQAYPLKSGAEVNDNDRVFFVDAVYLVNDKVCYEFLRQNSTINVYR